MYYRSQGYRYPQNMRIPINYGGNAFSEDDTPEKEKSSDGENTPDEAIEITNEESVKVTESLELPLNNELSAPKEAKSDDAPASLFNSFGSKSFLSRIGSEELLILALVFLLSDSDNDNDIIWLLLLLLFVK